MNWTARCGVSAWIKDSHGWGIWGGFELLNGKPRPRERMRVAQYLADTDTGDVPPEHDEIPAPAESAASAVKVA